MDMAEINKIIEEMTIDDMCGQLLCYNVPGRWSSPEEFEETVKHTLPGSIFVSSSSKQIIKDYTAVINKYTKVPAIVAADLENGPGCAIKEDEFLPHPMAWGACDDADLIERAGEATAEVARKNGIHWTFSPIIDINMNPDNPVTNIRAISDSYKQVAKIGTAYSRGLQKNNMMVAGCKHFPGDGVDDRNQHFCTTINSLSKEEWMETFGYVYKEMIKSGALSVMAAHIALPAYDNDMDEPVLGPKPAILSKKLMTGLLKEELGFDGCIVSDALSMVGSCSMVEENDLITEFIKAGGDVALFPVPEDFDTLKAAVQSGEISMERLKDAVRRVLIMKYKVRLMGDEKINEDEIVLKHDIKKISQEIAEKSIKIVRNTQDILPLKLKKGDKILVINLQKKEEERSKASHIKYLDTFVDELKDRGFEIIMLEEGMIHRDVERLMKDAACILVNCKMSCQDYGGGSLRIGWEHIMPFWRGVIFRHPCMVFTTFGDPYKLYDFPYLRTYINAFSSAEATQKAVVKVLFGEIEAQGKNPVTLKGFFEREVE